MQSFLIFSSLVLITIQKMQILQPQELQSKFANQNLSIPFSVANFGHIPWGRKIIGTVLLAEPRNACTAITLDRHSDNERYIVLVNRGNCTFVTKVRNAQLAGANLVVIVDDTFEQTDQITMADDGYGSTVKIPSVFIGEQEGEIIENYIQSQELVDPDNRQGVVMVVKFNTSISDNPHVVLALTLSSRETFKLVREFEPYYHALKDSNVNFKIYFDYYVCQHCINENYTTVQKDCLGGGRYCALDPDGDDLATGIDILNEQLRSICIFRNFPELWFKYMERFDENCIQYKDFQKCSDKQISKVGINSEIINSCFEGSFNESTSKDRKLQTNLILEKQRRLKFNKLKKIITLTFREYSGVRFFPGAVINNQSYLGSIDADDIFGEICNSMFHPPVKCRTYLDDLSGIQTEEVHIARIIVIVIVVLVIFFLFMVFICRRMVKKEMSRDMNQQVVQMVSQYISFYESKEKH